MSKKKKRFKEKNSNEIEIDHDLFEIDDDDLDGEWSKHPKEVFKYWLKLADAQNRLDRAKAAKEVKEAELDRKIRHDPTKYDLPKETEGAIKAVVTVKLGESQEMEEYLDAKHEVDVCKAYTTALFDRRSALEQKVKMQFGMYYGEPRTPEGVDRKVVEDMTDRAAFRLKKKKRK